MNVCLSVTNDDNDDNDDDDDDDNEGDDNDDDNDGDIEGSRRRIIGLCFSSGAAIVSQPYLYNDDNHDDDTVDPS